MVQILKFKRSNTNAAMTTLNSGEPSLHLGGTNNDVFFFIGNVVNKPILINNPPFKFSVDKPITPNVTIATGASYNLMQSFVAADITGGTKTNFTYIQTGFTYNNTNLSLIFPPFKNYVEYTIRVKLSGTISGTATTDRQFSIELRRGADNSLILEDYIIKLQNNVLDGMTRQYSSFTENQLDPFVTGGLRVVVKNDSGANIVLTNINILIQGNATNFIQ